MSKKSYYEMLKDPRWQRKRLEIMQRADFKCEDCKTAEKTLNIHHSYYEKGLAPWEYPDKSLHCLCEDCHEIAQDLIVILHRLLGQLPDRQSLEEIIGYASAKVAKKADIPVEIFSFFMAMGVADFYRINPTMILNNCIDGVIDDTQLEELATSVRLARRGKNGSP